MSKIVKLWLHYRHAKKDWKKPLFPASGERACFYCPASRKVEVQELREKHPDLYARAVAMERNAAPNMQKVKGLGRHWSWEELPVIAPETVEQTCMCFDGSEGEV